MRHDILVDALHVIRNAEHIGKQMCIIPASSLVRDVLKIMNKHNYIGNFEFIDNGKSGHFEVNMIGKINESRAIKPRFAVRKDEFEKWEARYLPAKDFGIIIISTPKGVMSQKEAIDQGIGGRLLAYVY